MDANHDIVAADQTSPIPPVVAPFETAETAANAALPAIVAETQEELKEETKTEEEQSDEQDPDDDDDSDYTIGDDSSEDDDDDSDSSDDDDSDSSDSDDDDSEISEVDSDRTVPAVRGEQQIADVVAVREEHYSSDGDYDVHSDYSDGYSASGYPFERFYTCGPITGNSREHLEQGNLIVMPESALGELYRARPAFPMLFEIRNHAKDRVSHCGVAEFTAEEGSVMVPGWMMENLKAEAGETLFLKNVTLEKGTYAKIQPHSVAFWAIRDVKTTLEQTLSAKFLCLTTGDTIAIDVGSKKYYVDIVETKPDDAVCIVDTDCAVDFALPLDYKEPEPAPAPAPPPSRGFVPFTGVARRLNESAVATQSVVAESFAMVEAEPVATAAETSQGNEPRMPFQPFTGRKYTLAD